MAHKELHKQDAPFKKVHHPTLHDSLSQRDSDYLFIKVQIEFQCFEIGTRTPP